MDRKSKLELGRSRPQSNLRCLRLLPAHTVLTALWQVLMGLSELTARTEVHGTARVRWEAPWVGWDIARMDAAPWVGWG